MKNKTERDPPIKVKLQDFVARGNTQEAIQLLLDVNDPEAAELMGRLETVLA